MMDVSYWVVMPAAGAGSRMGSATPKQYLPLQGRMVIEWALQPFLDDPRCRAVVVAIAADDARWSQLPMASHWRVHAVPGGSERADSVLAGLKALTQLGATANEWVLVHDAARPCLTRADLEPLLQVTGEESVGALLATPVAETLKRAGADGRVLHTVSRDALWRAQTPQMFRYSLLLGALQNAQAQGRTVTDEASAVEALGLLPRLLPGPAANLKITEPADLSLAEQILRSRSGTS